MADEDIDLNLDDEPEDEVQEDEALQYLSDEPEEGSDEAKEKAKKDEEERLQAIVDAKIAARFVNQPPATEPAAPTRRGPEPELVVPNADELLDKMAEEIAGDIALDPKKAVKRIMETSRALAGASAADSALRANQILIENFRAARKDDPIFKAVRDDFDRVVAGYTDKQWGAASAAQVRKALEDIEDAATGRYYKTQLTKRTEQRQASKAPNYGGSGGSSASAVATTKTLSKAQRDLIKMGKNAGLSDKAIRELVRENA